MEVPKLIKNFNIQIYLALRNFWYKGPLKKACSFSFAWRWDADNVESLCWWKKMLKPGFNFCCLLIFKNISNLPFSAMKMHCMDLHHQYAFYLHRGSLEWVGKNQLPCFHLLFQERKRLRLGIPPMRKKLEPLSYPTSLSKLILLVIGFVLCYFFQCTVNKKINLFYVK